MAVLGQDPARAPFTIYRNIGVLPEQNGLYDWMSGEDYLAFFAALHGLSPESAMIAARLGAVGLSPRRGQRIRGSRAPHRGHHPAHHVRVVEPGAPAPGPAQPATAA